ncbi:hypothetical protein [Kangiella sp.]|uniref:hypothetical protein n=1 Tax=Kangiella sp. TaxID=1920245 RepID=UPI003A911C84
MCFPRKPSLGRYSGTRAEWHCAYRAARVAAGQGLPPNPAYSGIQWKAQLIVAYERPLLDPLACSVLGRLAAYRIIEEIVSDERKAVDTSESYLSGWEV